MGSQVRVRPPRVTVKGGGLAFPVEHRTGKQEEESEQGHGLDLIQSMIGSLRDPDSSKGEWGQKQERHRATPRETEVAV